MPTFARAESGDFSGYTSTGWNLSVFEATVTRDFLPTNVTEAGDSATVVRTSTRIVYRVQARAWLQDGGGSYVHLADNMGSVSGSLYGRTSLAILQKDHGDPLNVTAAEDAVPLTEWDLQLPIYSGAIRTHLQASETPLDSAQTPNASPASLTLPLGSVTVSATSYVTRVGNEPNFRRGGPVEADYQFQLSGPVTAPGTPFEDDSFSATLDLDNGQTMSGTVRVNRLRADLDYRRASVVPFEFEGVFSGAVTFSV